MYIHPTSSKKDVVFYRRCCIYPFRSFLSFFCRLFGDVLQYMSVHLDAIVLIIIYIKQNRQKLGELYRHIHCAVGKNATIEAAQMRVQHQHEKKSSIPGFVSVHQLELHAHQGFLCP